MLPCGDAAILLEVADLGAVFALVEALRAQQTAWHLLDIVAGARTVLVRVEPGADLAPIRSRVHELAVNAPQLPIDTHGKQVQIDVVYDGPDLQEVTHLTGLSRDEVIAAHTGTPWRVGFGGFAPGFAYLVDGDERLHVTRRAQPRTTVPPGSVGLAGEFSGIYPRSSPGGWQLIGRTDAPLWDIDRDPPALLQVGSTVRFVAIT